MAERWQQGQRPVVEDYLDQHPELAEVPEAILELISQEICLRQEHGEAVQSADLEHRFPHWRRQVRGLLECHLVLSAGPSPLCWPSSGQILGEFQLLAELGRGAHARVFLARQGKLADRPVVLKVGPHTNQEHLQLARLQHSHIVPLYSAHDFHENGLRGLCLPWFGGATLADLLAVLPSQVPPARRCGRDLVDALRRLQAQAPMALPVDGPACRFLSRASYVQAVCWLGACLADALGYAQERGLVHLDLKPSNVLLAADGQPMLLDFHLARAPLPAGSAPPAWLGGTPGYMAPEQIAALRAVAEGRPLPAAIDGRTDIHALGKVLYELLGGAAPSESESPGTALRRRNPAVSRGLTRLVERCLAGDPAKRYPDAASLAEDLRRHLNDLPLRGVADRAPLERWRKWRRRRPATLPVLVLLVGIAAAGAGLVWHAGQQMDRARAALRQGQESLHHRHYSEALDRLRHGAALAESLPLADALRQELRDAGARAERGLAADELHRFCERLRPLHGMEPLPARQARAVLERCQQLWQDRGRLRRGFEEHRDTVLREQLRADLLDLAIVWAHLRGQVAEHRAALEILRQAEEEFGPSHVLFQERRAHALALGRKDTADEAARAAAALPPSTAWEHFALGRALYRAGDWRRALREVDLALQMQPGALWPTFYRGCCAFRLRQYEEAIVAFSVCQALAGDQACLFCNRGLAYLEMGRLDRARADLDRALTLEPNQASAALGRGIVNYRDERFRESRADLEHTLRAGLDSATVRFNLALVHLALQDPSAARANAQLALRHDPEHAQARQLLERLP
jgi:serine/threonine protein kinase/Tfp pilus assembly protein PilF